MRVFQSFRNVVSSLALMIFLLAYFIAALSILGAIHRDWRPYSIYNTWTAVSVYLGTAVLLFWGEPTTQALRLALQSSPERQQQSVQFYSQARTLCWLEWCLKTAYVLALLLGLFVLEQSPKSMIPWYKTAHERLSSIQGPLLLALVWSGYITYVLLVQQIRSLPEKSSAIAANEQSVDIEVQQ